MSDLFIRRPVATILLAIGLALAGFFAYRQLPVAALPQVDYPTISVSANLAGASPDTMATAVTTPLIKQFQTIAGIDTITAQSSLGSAQIVLQFALDRNIDAAAADVQAAIAAVSRRLPPTMTSPPTYRKANPADAPILLLTVNSATLPLTDVDNLAQNVIAPTISTIDGVAEAQVMGAQTYAVRVDAEPAQLAARGLDVSSLSDAIADANSHTPLGTVGNDTQTITVDANTQLTDAAGFRSLIVSDSNGRPVRLGDVARVYDSVQNLKTASWYDGGRAIVLAVMRQPGANTVAVADAIRAQLPALRAALPEAVSIDVMNDASTSIRNAVHDVGFTLALVVALVMLVIYLFLGRLLPTFVPGLAVPLSLLAACGGMYLLGFSIDNISLLGLTLSVGLVVDDAIVMLENIVRRVEAGETPMAAALAGSREVGWTIVSMSVSLVAVFIPLLLMGGVIGRLFSELGLVVAMAIVASAAVSLTLTPMLAARLPAPSRTHRSPGIIARSYAATLAGYDRGVVWCLRHRVTIFVVFLGTIAASAWLLETLPTTFFPQEYTGQLIVSTQARDDISFVEMSTLQQQVEAAVRASPDVAHVASSVGGGFGGSANNGTLFVQLKPAGQRPELQTVLADLRRALAPVAGVRTFITPTQSLRVGGRQSRAQYQVVIQALTDGDARTWAGKFADAMTARPAVFTDVNSDTDNSAPAVLIDVDQDHAAALGVTAASIRQALGTGFGGDTPATIETGSGSFDVIVEYDQALQWNDAMLAAIQLKTTSGALVPLSAFAKVVRSSGPITVNQTGELRSATISFNLPNGVALGTATDAVNSIRAGLGVPPSVIVAFGGTAQVFAQSAATEGLLIAAAIVTIYLVLGILYESFVHPLTILSGLPAAAFGALLALKLAGLDLSVIAMIGILMLIGIVKKNAIMMVDVALQLQRTQNMPAAWAIREACQRRFRPIMMTTFCAILGVLPIALGTGASSELRQPLGVAVVGGLVTSQLLTLFITPVIYTALDEVPGRLRGLARALGGVLSGGWGGRAARSAD